MEHEDIELKTNKRKNYIPINIYNRWGLVISSVLIAVSLIVCWIIWIDWYRKDINEIIKTINPYLNFTFEFQHLTIVVLVFATINLFLIAIPFLFLKNKNRKTIIIIGIVTLVTGIIMILGTMIFLIIINKGLATYINNNSFRLLAVFIIPCILEIIYALFLVANCLWLFVPIFWKAKTKNQFTNLKPEQLSINVDELNAKSKSNPFSTMKITENKQTKKGVSPIDPTKPTIWTQAQIAEVWAKGQIDPQLNPELYRKDYAGALIFKKAFVNDIENNDNNIKSLNWTIVYEKPVINGGTQALTNLKPLNINNALKKGTDYPKWKTAVAYNGNENYAKEKKWKDKA